MQCHLGVSLLFLVSEFFFSTLSITFVSVWVQSNTIRARPDQQAAVMAITSLPWSFKMLCGFLSDSVPIRQQRRKPYFIIGWTVFSGSFVVRGSCNPQSMRARLRLMGHLRLDTHDTFSDHHALNLSFPHFFSFCFFVLSDL
jgi:hypothetical protein